MRLLELFDSNAISVKSEIVDPTHHEHGTIVLLKPSKASKTSIRTWCEDHGIPCINADELHCTVLFSRHPVEHLSKLHEKPINVAARVKSWKKLGSALTLELDSPTASKLHEWMCSQGGTHDYPEYIAHTTVSYQWPQDDVPTECPQMMMEFDRLVVKPIDPKYASKSKSD